MCAIAAFLVSFIVFAWFRMWFVAVVVGIAAWQITAIRKARNANEQLTDSVRMFLGIVDGGLTGVSFGILHGWLHYPVSDSERVIVTDWWLGQSIVCSVFCACCGVLIGILITMTPRDVRAASIRNAVGGAAVGLLISYTTRSAIPGAQMLVGCACSVLCAVAAVGLVMWRGGFRSTPAMRSCSRWIYRTLRLASLLLSFALLLLLIAVPLADVLNRRYRFDDDWTVLTLPVGAILGLYVGVRYRDRQWLNVMATMMLVVLIGFAIYLAIPQQAPDSIPPGMNRLPIALGNMQRAALLYVMIIAGSVSGVVAAVTHVILQPGPMKRKNP